MILINSKEMFNSGQKAKLNMLPQLIIKNQNSYQNMQKCGRRNASNRLLNSLQRIKYQQIMQYIT